MNIFLKIFIGWVLLSLVFTVAWSLTVGSLPKDDD